MGNTILKKENGVVSTLEATPELEELICSGCHLCWDKNCANARANLCSKVFDEHKKHIKLYDYITDGAQILDEEGNVQNFIVSKCNNYKLSRYEETTQIKNTREIKTLRDNLKKAYFGAETIDEADILQYELAQKGQIINASELPSEEEVEAMRAREKYRKKGLDKNGIRK